MNYGGQAAAAAMAYNDDWRDEIISAGGVWNCAKEHLWRWRIRESWETQFSFFKKLATK